jgi:hypothetical protein
MFKFVKDLFRSKEIKEKSTQEPNKTFPESMNNSFEDFEPLRVPLSTKETGIRN